MAATGGSRVLCCPSVGDEEGTAIERDKMEVRTLPQMHNIHLFDKEKLGSAGVVQLRQVSGGLDEQELKAWMQRIDGKIEALLASQANFFTEQAKQTLAMETRGNGYFQRQTSPGEQNGERRMGKSKSNLMDPEKPKLGSRLSFETQGSFTEAVEIRLDDPEGENESKTGEADDQSRRSGSNRTSRFTEICSSAMLSASKFTHAPMKEPPPTFWQRVVRGKAFAGLVVFVVLLNAVIIGVQAQYAADGKNEGARREIFDAIGHLCSAFYAFELGLRLVVEPLHKHLQPEDRGWFAMDCGLVVMCGVELALQIGSFDVGLNRAINAGRMIRSLKLVKVTRVVKAFRFLTQLRVMVSMILSSLASLFWLFVLLFLMVYVCAVVLTQGVADFVETDGPDDPRYAELEPKFKDVPTTIETLFAITTGAEWSEEGLALRKINAVLYTVLMMYIFFSFFSVLNIVNGVFVESAIRYSKQDRDLVAEQKAQERKLAREACAADFRRILSVIDIDDDNLISLQEFRTGLTHHNMLHLLETLEVEIESAEELFELLDVDESGEITVEEFVTGLLKLRSEPSPFEMQLLIYQNRKILQRMDQVTSQPAWNK
mmetsp:Transcript_29268/g.67380  ORF Transcript_29268/g.67380 Transcript_29268/m.67380 type:complete len:601 (-) Transcript_29268:63-1865(-)